MGSVLAVIIPIRAICSQGMPSGTKYTGFKLDDSAVPELLIGKTWDQARVGGKTNKYKQDASDVIDYNAAPFPGGGEFAPASFKKGGDNSNSGYSPMMTTGDDTSISGFTNKYGTDYQVALQREGQGA